MVGAGDLVLFYHTEVGLSGFQIEADFAAVELGAEDPLGLLLHFLDYVVSQAGSEVGAAVVDFVVGVPIGAQLSQQARGNAGGLPWVGNDVGEAAGEPGYADRLVDVEIPLRVVDGVGVADVYGCRLPFWLGRESCLAGQRHR